MHMLMYRRQRMFIRFWCVCLRLSLRVGMRTMWSTCRAQDSRADGAVPVRAAAAELRGVVHLRSHGGRPREEGAGVFGGGGGEGAVTVCLINKYDIRIVCC